MTDSQDRQQLAALYDAFFDRIFGFAMRRLGSVADAEDVTAAVFYKALKEFRSKRFRGGSVTSWLYRIASNEICSLMRSRRREIDVPDEQLELASDAAQHAELERAEAALAVHRFFLDVSDVLRELKPLDQDLIALRYFEDKSYREVAEIVGKREGAVTMRTRRALEKLRAQLRTRGYDDETVQRSLAQDVEAGSFSGNFQAELTVSPPV